MKRQTPARRISGLPPIARADARVLILGSMPGARSLAMQQYYAHPANAFWRLISAVLGEDVPADYAARRALLLRRHIALWDVVGSCRRPGSLDSSIDPRSVRPNDIRRFVAEHRQLKAVFFNGGTAHALLRRHFLDLVDEDARQGLGWIRLPSSSPANASWSFERKRDAWMRLAACLQAPAAAQKSASR